MCQWVWYLMNVCLLFLRCPTVLQYNEDRQKKGDLDSSFQLICRSANPYSIQYPLPTSWLSLIIRTCYCYNHFHPQMQHPGFVTCECWFKSQWLLASHRGFFHLNLLLKNWNSPMILGVHHMHNRIHSSLMP